MVNSFLADLTLVLGVATFTCALTQFFRVPLILGYLVAGLIIGPYITVIPLFADHKQVETISELGIIFVMFCVGLEFRFKNLAQIIPRSGLMAVIQIVVLMVCGHALGRLLGWSNISSLFLGASLSISSTMVVSKIYNSDNNNSSSPLDSGAKEIIFGVLILQDIIAIVLIAALTALAAGIGLSFREMGGVVGRLTGVMALLLGGGIIFVPRLIRFVLQFRNTETVIVTVCGICFCMAFIAEFFGYSVALGAFIAGVLVAESGFGYSIERLMLPMRDLFSAIFFVSVGMTVDPTLVIRHLPTSLIVSVLVIAGQFISIFTTGMVTGKGLKRSVISGLALGQIGEFAFIISAVGLHAGVLDPIFRPIMVTVAVITSLTSPLLFKRSDIITSYLDRTIPNRIRIIFSFYESLLEKFQIQFKKIKDVKRRYEFIRPISILALDAIIIFLLISLIGPNLRQFSSYVGHIAHLNHNISNILLIILLFILMAPFMVQFVRNFIFLENMIIKTIIGEEDLKNFNSQINSQIDSQIDATTKILKTLMNSFTFFMAGLPVFILFSVFIENYIFIAGFFIWGIVIYLFIWKKAGIFEQEMISGTKLYLKYLEQKLLKSGSSSESLGKITPPLSASTASGLREVTQIEIKEQSLACGKSLSELNLRAITGATVIAIIKSDDSITLPKGPITLMAQDILSVVGTEESIALAKELLDH